MADSLKQIKIGLFPKLTSSRFHETMIKFTHDVIKDTDHKTPYVSFYNEGQLLQDFNNIAKIKQLEPKKYDFYMDKFSQKYQESINYITYSTSIWIPHGQYNSEELYLTLSPRENSLNVTIGTYSGTNIYEETFTGDVESSFVNEQIKMVLKKRLSDRALNELSYRYS